MLRALHGQCDPIVSWMSATDSSYLLCNFREHVLLSTLSIARFMISFWNASQFACGIHLRQHRLPKAIFPHSNCSAFIMLIRMRANFLRRIHLRQRGLPEADVSDSIFNRPVHGLLARIRIFGALEGRTQAITLGILIPFDFFRSCSDFPSSLHTAL